MAVKHGFLPEFVPGTEEWGSYVERAEHYFEANGVDTQETRRAVLLSSCGAPTYRLIRNLSTPLKPGEKTYKEIVELVASHLQPKPSVIMQRFKFNSRVRGEGESIADFAAALRQLSEHCAFGDTLQDVLRDRLVCGVKDERIQRRLLGEVELTFARAFQIALAVESANKHAIELQSSVPTTVPPVINAVGSRPKDKAKKVIECYRCGGNHYASSCRFKGAICSQCGKRGHLAKVCRGVTHKREDAVEKTHRINDEENEEEVLQTLNVLGLPKVQPFIVPMEINGARIDMELDTGAAMTVISKRMFEDLWGSSEKGVPTLHPTGTRLSTYTGEPLSIAGVAEVVVSYKSQTARLPLLVVNAKGPNLLGRNWLQVIKIDWGEIHNVRVNKNLEELLEKHRVVFQDELGTLKGVFAKFSVDPLVSPRFYKARSVPYVLKDKIEVELRRLETSGVIRPVPFADWAAPIVPIVKEDGTVRICGDYKLTVNQASKLESYPVPRVEDLFASLSGGRLFSKIDLTNAYQQMRLDDASKAYTTINTHKGLFEYNRLPFGVASAPAMFQRAMECVLQGIDHTVVYVDDILVTGASIEEHLHTLDKVLSKLAESGLRLKKAKCIFMASSVEYLGHRIDREGLHPTDAKVQAINEAQSPKNITELKSFLGLLNYYSKFLPNLASKLSSLYQLLRKQQKWSWTSEQEQAFAAAKNMLKTSALLVHYDSHKPILLACDASPYGIGAVLSHEMEDGSERPIGFVSRTLSPAEKGYSQLDKEALAIYFGVSKFHQYLYGRPFTIFSDHKPLIYLFGEHRGIPPMASSRIQRWALALSTYQYSIRYKSGAQHANADAFSRLPSPQSISCVSTPGDVLTLLDLLSTIPITVSQIRGWTDRDPVLSRVRGFVKSGWPGGNLGDDLSSYQQKKNELSVLDGCLLWGARVIIPPQGRQQVLAELHESHPGINKMKGLARGYVWWPNMDKEIEDVVKQCDTCQSSRFLPPVAPLHPWEWPQEPWSRVHIDFAGPFMGHMFLVLIDAHSKWLEVHLMKSISAVPTIERLKSIFAIHGVPRKIVTDNGPAFVSEEFRLFMSQNGIIHVKSAPYHPSTNGLAERAVQTFKQGLLHQKLGSIETKLSCFLFKYRLTPHSTTGSSPAELLLGRRPRSRLDILHPDLAVRVESRQAAQKQDHDTRGISERKFVEGDLVYVRDFRFPKKWIPGVIVTVTGPLSYTVKIGSGVVRRHIDHLRARHNSQVDASDDVYVDNPNDITSGPSSAPVVSPSSSDERAVPTADSSPSEPCVQAPPEVPPSIPSTVGSPVASAEDNDVPQPPVPISAPVRRSTRVRKTPDYYGH